MKNLTVLAISVLAIVLLVGGAFAYNSQSNSITSSASQIFTSNQIEKSAEVTEYFETAKPMDLDKIKAEYSEITEKRTNNRGSIILMKEGEKTKILLSEKEFSHIIIEIINIDLRKNEVEVEASIYYTNGMAVSGIEKISPKDIGIGAVNGINIEILKIGETPWEEKQVILTIPEYK